MLNSRLSIRCESTALVSDMKHPIRRLVKSTALAFRRRSRAGRRCLPAERVSTPTRAPGVDTGVDTLLNVLVQTFNSDLAGNPGGRHGCGHGDPVRSVRCRV